ncbi:phosphotransferase family protein [Streptosporangium sp. NPDC000509]|uniref:phosphotransferase family protein n=1 Tax=Streptosporangium sp. NPDC000509 TaxID=3366186 RepID=UPI0036CCD1EE
MTGQSSTHGIEMHPDRVIKTFESWGRGEHEQEWRALTLLAEYAPELAPLPLEAHLEAEPPVVVMSRLDGVPLRGLDVTSEQIEAMAEAITTLHRAIPMRVLVDLAPSAWNPSVAIAKAQRLQAATPDLGGDPVVAEAFAAGSKWLVDSRLDRLMGEMTPVFGLSDSNLANYLWDGKRIRLIDWEDSGRSDRAFELAEAVEHISQVDGIFDGPALLEHLDLSVTETARVLAFRRLFAFSWMCMLGPGSSFSARNPYGTLERQAERLLGLLS